ncbi:MBOAT family O-acyltransferase [Halioxenophilus sp. WMMB6]|uniref:MBOAT family O-acyltransferase n=1 Tax=Halioxenophilus sp. WMMB6 TaxID=3073815 RepID=UPI00295F3C99|nr:MBOAT family O-acyltransferase [Halioxenophilus sp. WMMB6]
MLFNSFIFLLLFLPATLACFYLARRYLSVRWAIAILVVGSFVFYSYWNPSNLPILLGSIVFNYLLGQRLTNLQTSRHSKLLLILGVTANLALLAYFKYTNFFIANLNTLITIPLPLQNIVLPLAISFFTFQQVAYLVDSYRGVVIERNFLNYVLFVSFFPQLIAGPIVHHKEMMPQFAALPATGQWRKYLGLGTALFCIGLGKKVLLADNFAVYANQLFNQVDANSLLIGDAWIGAISYHFQIYFDFSGYSDMAIGLAYMFGIRLPINFDSPYKAQSIIVFWRRWHMTLSRFLRDYLYITLGGNRKGKLRRHANLLMTMLLGGLWHGAAWTFVVWGALHGGFLVINHLFHVAARRVPFAHLFNSRLFTGLGIVVTTLAVMVAWVYFRAGSLSDANTVVMALFGRGELGISHSLNQAIQTQSFAPFLFLLFNEHLASWCVVLCLILVTQAFILLAPNSMQILDQFERIEPTSSSKHSAWEFLCAAALALSIIGMFGISEFIYFQF